MLKLLSRKPKTDPALKHYPEPLANLISYGEPAEDTDYAAWAVQLAPYTTDLVKIALDADLNKRDEHDPAAWAPLHAIKVLGVLGPIEAAEPLTEYMEDAWFDEELPKVYAAIGPGAIPALRAYLFDAAHESHARSLASECLTAIAQRHAEANAEVVDLLIAFLDRPEADDSAAEESVTTSVIYDLSTSGARTAYDAIRRAFAEDRVTPSVITLESVEIDFGMRRPAASDPSSKRPRESGVRLELRCTACGRERAHIFPRVFYDLTTAKNKKKSKKYDPLIIPQRVVCPKCGAVDQYELSGLGHIAIIASLLAESAERTGKTSSELSALPRNQRITLMQFTTRWGAMHPQEAIERYQREIARHPKDTSLRIGFASVLHTLGRLDEVEEQCRQVLALNNEHIDAWEILAQVAGQRGDIAQATDGWRNVLELAWTTMLPGAEREDLIERAKNSLAQLSQGVIPEFGPPVTGSSRPGSSYPSQPQSPAGPAPSAAAKVGRNEPCPCGSGKKYKHCHGQPDKPA